MPNKKGGKKFKKGKKGQDGFGSKQLIKKDSEESQEYAQVMDPMGNGRFKLLCCDGGKERTGIVCGKMRKRVWINRSDLVLISKWEDMTDDSKCSIIHKYSEDEAKRLLKEGDLPPQFQFNLDDFEECVEDNGFDMGDPSESESESESSEEDIDVDEI
tara:strand:+ start:671 stop:1144 length:474 start_codon:yes stop_codon:yes gene_type:complete